MDCGPGQCDHNVCENVDSILILKRVKKTDVEKAVIDLQYPFDSASGRIPSLALQALQLILRKQLKTRRDCGVDPIFSTKNLPDLSCQAIYESCGQE